MAINPTLKKPKTQDEIDDAFEIWLECAHELSILDLYQVISYDCEKENDTVIAITFAVDQEALLKHMKNILAEQIKSIDMCFRKESSLVKIENGN